MILYTNADVSVRIIPSSKAAFVFCFFLLLLFFKKNINVVLAYVMLSQQVMTSLALVITHPSHVSPYDGCLSKEKLRVSCEVLLSGL